MTIRRKVISAPDGDTLKLRNKLRGTNYLRIAGMNAPERGERGFATAKNRLARLVGKTVTIIPKGRSYNRVVADIRYKRRLIR